MRCRSFWMMLWVYGLLMTVGGKVPDRKHVAVSRSPFDAIQLWSREAGSLQDIEAGRVLETSVTSWLWSGRESAFHGVWALCGMLTYPSWCGRWSRTREAISPMVTTLHSVVRRIQTIGSDATMRVFAMLVSRRCSTQSHTCYSTLQQVVKSRIPFCLQVIVFPYQTRWLVSIYIFICVVMESYSPHPGSWSQSHPEVHLYCVPPL